jgi:hypothetical protein
MPVFDALQRQFFKLSPLLSIDDLATVTVGNRRPIPEEGPIENWDPRELAVYHLDPTKRDLLSDISQPRYLISSKFRDVIQQLVPSQVQFLPLRLQSLDGEREYQGFSLLRVLPWLSKKELTSVTEELLIFRMPSPVGAVFVSQPLRDCIIDARLQQITFS